MDSFDLHSKVKIIMAEQPPQWFDDIISSTPTTEFLPKERTDPSSSKLNINKQIIIKNQVGRQINKTILFIETSPEITRENEIYVSPHSTHKQLSIHLNNFLTENDHHVNILHDQKSITKLLSVIDEYYLGDKLCVYISKYLPEMLMKQSNGIPCYRKRC